MQYKDLKGAERISNIVTSSVTKEQVDLFLEGLTEHSEVLESKEGGWAAVRRVQSKMELSKLMMTEKDERLTGLDALKNDIFIGGLLI